MPDDFAFAPPPFEPRATHATLARLLRDLKLVERQGAFEWHGCPVVRLQIGDDALQLDVAKTPVRAPSWVHHAVRDHGMLRRVVDDLKKRLKAWDERRDD